MDRRTRQFVIWGIVLALVVAGGLSLLASGEPDGLERVAIDKGFDEEATDPAVTTPLSDYGVAGVEDDRLSTALAGIIGVVITLGVTVGILQVARRRNSASDAP